MKKISVIIFVIALSVLKLNAEEVKGDTTTINGYKVITAEGTHYERGFAYGYLLGFQINDIIQNYLVNEVFNGEKSGFDLFKDQLNQNFTIDEKYISEANGILAGMEASGARANLEDFFDRSIDIQDLLCGNIIVEVSALFGCSSLSLWGDRSNEGSLNYTRNLDWSLSPALIRNHLIAVHYPSEADEQPWMSFGFPGLIGILSGINAKYVGAFHHMGDHVSYPNPNGKSKPIFFSIRNGLESKDFNDDGSSDNMDVYSSISQNYTSGAFIINAINGDNSGDVAIVIETNAEKGTVYRNKEENTNLSGDLVASTNHFRKLYEPASCWRYANLISDLNNTEFYDMYGSWEVLSDAAGVSNNLQTIQFIPNQDLIRFAITSTDSLAYRRTPNTINLLDYFNVQSVEDQKSLSIINIFPNPASEEVYYTVNNNLLEQSNYKLTLIDITGKSLFAQSTIDNYGSLSLEEIPSGVYYLNIEISNDKNKKVFVEKIVVNK